MNDRYLSKAKVKYNGNHVFSGQWIDGYYYYDQFENVHRIKHIEEDEYGNIVSVIDLEIDPLTLSQCTGLKDSKGKLIFEGDILTISYPEWDCAITKRVVHGYNYDYPAFDLDQAYTITHESNALQLVTVEDYYVLVNGNIHDRRNTYESER